MKKHTFDKELTKISMKYLAEDFSNELELWLIEKRSKGSFFSWDELCDKFFVKK